MVKKVIRFIVLIIGLSLVAYSGYHLFKIFWDYRTSDKTYEKLQDAYTVDDSKKSDDNDSEAADTPWYDDIDIDFAGLRSENPDVVGWIYFENEDISYPVMYSGDNSYYLRPLIESMPPQAPSFLKAQTRLILVTVIPSFTDTI